MILKGGTFTGAVLLNVYIVHLHLCRSHIVVWVGGELLAGLVSEWVWASLLGFRAEMPARTWPVRLGQRLLPGPDFWLHGGRNSMGASGGHEERSDELQLISLWKPQTQGWTGGALCTLWFIVIPSCCNTTKSREQDIRNVVLDGLMCTGRAYDAEPVEPPVLSQMSVEAVCRLRCGIL